MTMNPDVSLLQLAEHEGALRRLARCLTTDPEDLEQETRLRWWQEGGGVRDVGAWLGTVMRNLAHNNRRGAQRRGRREQEVAKNADAAVPSPEDLVARSEVFALMVGVVNELPEARRQVIVLVFFEGLEVREAAARLGLSVARVYELRRLALGDLRGRLDARHGRETWMGMLVPLAGGREVVGVGASTGKSALGGGKGVGLLGALVIVMKTKTAAIAVLLLSVLLLIAYGASLVEWAPDSVPVAVNPASATTDAREAGRGDPEDRVATPHDRMERTEVAARNEPLAHGSLVVKTYWNDGLPAPAVMVIATRDGDNLGTQGVRRNTGQQGVARFERLPVGKYTVRSNRACRYESAAIEAGTESVLEMRLRLGIDVTGMVRKPDGGPADNAQIEVMDTLIDDWYGLLPVCCTDVNGHFVARALSDDISLVARSADSSASEVTMVSAREGDVKHVELILGESGGKLGGRVLDHVGRPVEDATVMIGFERQSFWQANQIDPNSWMVMPAMVRSGTDGVFHANGLPLGRQEIMVRAPGFAAWEGAAMVRQEAMSTVQVDLVPGASLRGTVVDDSGRAIPRVTVSAGNPRGWKKHVTGSFVETDTEGRFEMHSLNPGDVDVILDAHDRMGGGATVCRVALLPGQVSECTLKMVRNDARDAIVVVVVDGNGRPVAEANCSGDEGKLEYWSNDADEAGRLRVGVSGPVVRLRVSKTGYCPATVCINVKDRRECTVVLRREEPASAFVRGSVRSSVGAGVADQGKVSLVSHEMGVWQPASVSQSGAFESLPVRPGRYLLVLAGQGSPGIRLGPVLLEAGQTWDVGEQLLPVGGRLVVGSAPQGALRLNVLGEAGLEIPLHQVAEGYRSEKLPPGRYRLSVAGDGVAAQMLPFEIEDGVDTEIALATEVGIPRDFEIDLLLPDNLPTEVRLRIDSGAEEVAAVSIQVNALRLAHRAWLQPGEYVATVSGRLHGEDREFASMRFRVADIDAGPVRLEVR